MNFLVAPYESSYMAYFVLVQPVDTKGKQNSFSVVFGNNYFTLNDHFVLSA